MWMAPAKLEIFSHRKDYPCLCLLSETEPRSFNALSGISLSSFWDVLNDWIGTVLPKTRWTSLNFNKFPILYCWFLILWKYPVSLSLSFPDGFVYQVERRKFISISYIFGCYFCSLWGFGPAYHGVLFKEIWTERIRQAIWVLIIWMEYTALFCGICRLYILCVWCKNLCITTQTLKSHVL